MGWTEVKDQLISFIGGVFEDQESNILGDLMDIALPIVEEISGYDFNDDEMIDHTRKEILAIAEDKTIEWGANVTAALVEAAEGGFLKQLFAAAKIAEWIATLGILSSIPGSSYLINLAIEWALGAIKSGIKAADAKLNDVIEERVTAFQAVLKSVSEILTTRTGAYINTEHYWGTDLFKIIALPSMDSPEEDAVIIKGSLRGLEATAGGDKEDYEDLLNLYCGRIESGFGE